jgi:hypothetical protein
MNILVRVCIFGGLLKAKALRVKPLNMVNTMDPPQNTGSHRMPLVVNCSTRKYKLNKQKGTIVKIV